MLGQRWPNGQKAIGPTSAANVGLTDVLTLGQRQSDGGMLSGLPPWLCKTSLPILQPSAMKAWDLTNFKHGVSSRTSSSSGIMIG